MHVGLLDVMLFSTAAKAIGYSKFNSQSLQKWLSTNNGTHLTLGRTLFNPGPRKFPQMKHPYIQLTRWTGTKMVVMPVGAKKDGSDLRVLGHRLLPAASGGRRQSIDF